MILMLVHCRSHLCRSLAWLALAGVFALSSGGAGGQCVYDWMTSPGQAQAGVNGPVQALGIWQPNGVGTQPGLLVASGSFSVAGTIAVSGLAAWDGQRWSALGGGPLANALVTYNRDLIAGGSFTMAGGMSANHIARWDGVAWAALGRGLDGAVSALAVYGTNLVAGGSFTNADNVSIANIARWDGSKWLALGAGLDGPVTALAVYNGELVAAGSFTSAGGVSANGVARWDGSVWRPLGSGMTTIDTLAVYDGRLVAGGWMGPGGVAAWDGSSWGPLGSGLSGSDGVAVAGLAVWQGRLIAGGLFDHAVTNQVNCVACWDGVTWGPVGAGVSGGSLMGTVVSCLTVYNDQLVAGGDFTGAGGRGADHIAAWDGHSWSALSPNGSTDNSLDLGALALTPYEGSLVAGGLFEFAGGENMPGIAAWDGYTWNSVGGGVWGGFQNTEVEALTVYNNQLIAGGDFTGAGQWWSGGPVNATNIAAWDGVNWWPLGKGLCNRTEDSWVGALTVYNGRLVAGGYFDPGSIATWNGSSWQSLGGGLGPAVRALTVYNGTLIAGGEFTYAGNVVANFIAAWDGSRWQALGDGVNGYVYCLTVFNGQLIAGGGFGRAGGTNVSNIAAWNGSAWQPLGNGLPGRAVHALAVYNGKLIAGGNFAGAQDAGANYVASWDGSAWNPVGGGTDGPVLALATMSGELYLGGGFSIVGGQVCGGWARCRDSATAIVGQPLDQGACLGRSATFTVQATGTNLLYQWRKNGLALSDGPNSGGSTNQGCATASLTITEVTVEDAAAANAGYDVVVSGGCGTPVTSRRVALNLVAPPQVAPTILSSPTNQTVCLGASASFSVLASGTHLTYEWRKNGVPLTDGVNLNGSTYIGVSLPTLYIVGVTAADVVDEAKGYDVVVCGPCGAVSARAGLALDLTVSLPVIQVQPQALVTTVGQAAAFSVVAKAVGPLSCQWFKGGQALGDNSHITGAHSPTLSIAAAVSTDAGNYWVVVTGEGGEVNSQVAQLTVTPAGVAQWLPGDGLRGVDGNIDALTVWDPDGAGPQAPMLAAAGRFSLAGNVVVTNIAAWNGSSWQLLGPGLGGGALPCVKALAVYNGELVAAGSFTNSGPQAVMNVARWDGHQWQPLGTGVDGSVFALGVYQGRLIAGGSFANAGGVPAANIAVWNGLAWSSLNSGVAGGEYGAAVTSLTVYQGRLIVAGDFSMAGGVAASNIAAWDDASWCALGSGVAGTGLWYPVCSLAVYNGLLIVGGELATAGDAPVSFIAAWDGAAWQSLGSGLWGPEDPMMGSITLVSALTVFHGDLIATGTFTEAGTLVVNGIARWDGNAWYNLGSGLDGTGAALTVYQGELHVGGWFGRCGQTGAVNLARWDGNAWQNLGTGISGGYTTPRISALAEFNGDLVAGGDFLTLGGTNANCVARWDGTVWHPLGSGLDGSPTALLNYNGGLVVVGWFSQAGGLSVPGVAIWDGQSWAALGNGPGGVALALYNGQLVVGGDTVASWDGSQWHQIMKPGQLSVSAMTVYNGQLIAGGTPIYSPTAPYAPIVGWNGSSWQPLGSGPNNPVEHLMVYNGKLVVAGPFTKAGGIAATNLAIWDGSSWSAIPNNTYRATALGQFNGQLIASCWDGAQTTFIGGWTGTNWLRLGYLGNGGANALLDYRGQLVAAGLFDGVDGVVAVDWARLATRNEPAAVRLTIEYANGRLQLVWSSGTLQSADDATGSYSDVSGAGSPYQIIPAGRRKFYRLRL